MQEEYVLVVEGQVVVGNEELMTVWAQYFKGLDKSRCDEDEVLGEEHVLIGWQILPLWLKSAALML